MAVMSSSSRRSAGQRLGAFFELCKPRVNSLIVFTAMIGMFLATPSFPPFALFVAASIGIALVAGAAAAINCLIEQHIDALMARTRARPTARGEVSATETLTLATLVGSLGLWVLHSLRQPADDVADAGHLSRLRRDLHGIAEAGDADEHRHRRGFRRHATPPWLGGDDRSRLAPRRWSCS
jgi:hypothetical protein